MRLRALADKGLTMEHHAHARIAADTWLARRPRVRPSTENGEHS